jgi:large subunit ribosomal protein L9
MKVILLQNIKGVGQIGDIKEINDGYGRNFLLPRKMAKPATAQSVKEAELLKKKLKEVLELEHKKAIEIADKLKDVTLEVTEKANASGKLFAAVGRKEMAHKLKEVTGYDVAEDAIIIPEHAIKTVGEHVIVLELTNEVKPELKVIVHADTKPE